MPDERLEAEAAALETEIAQVCGVLNAATGSLVGLIAKVLDTGAYEGAGIRSPEQWVAWRCGLSAGRARKLVAMARRLPELAQTEKALASGELSEDQVAVVCRHAPSANDAEVAAFARHATVSQLARTLRSYTWADPPTGTDGAGEAEEAEPRRVSFGFSDEGSWRLAALLPPDEGALVERALDVARQSLAEEGDQPTWADALVGVAERCLAEGATARPQRDRHVVLIHMEATDHGPAAHLHLGPALPDALRRHLGCDGQVRAVAEAKGSPLSVGRAQRIVPKRTRVAVEDRDRGCRVPGCGRTRWLQVHHVAHWEDGGPTDTANLVALCSRHHRLHHLGQLGIEGTADDPDGIVFTDSKGRHLTGSGRPAPPGDLTITGTWVHPSGERLDPRWIHFSEPPGDA